MKSVNILRASVFAVGATFLIFIQDHSVPVGMGVLQFTTGALAIGGLALYVVGETKTNPKAILVPAAVAGFVLSVTIIFGSQSLLDAESRLLVFKSLVALFAGGTAIAELLFSSSADEGDKLELRLASAIGLVTGFVFWLAPLDGLNAVGFFSAYLSVSAVQRAIWAAAPNIQRKK